MYNNNIYTYCSALFWHVEHIFFLTVNHIFDSSVKHHHIFCVPIDLFTVFFLHDFSCLVPVFGEPFLPVAASQWVNWLNFSPIKCVCVLLQVCFLLEENNTDIP